MRVDLTPAQIQAVLAASEHAAEVREEALGELLYADSPPYGDRISRVQLRNELRSLATAIKRLREASLKG